MDRLESVLTIAFIGFLALQALGYRARRIRMDPRERAVVDYLRALAHSIEYGEASGGIVAVSHGWTTVEVVALGDGNQLPEWAGEQKGGE